MLSGLAGVGAIAGAAEAKPEANGKTEGDKDNKLGVAG
jgi:hypothetical protein